MSTRIRKFVRDFPMASVEIYIRTSNGETFNTGSLAEGICHLLSKEGYRLSIKEYTDDGGIYNIQLRRFGNQITCEMDAPMLQDWPATPENQIVIKPDWKSEGEEPWLLVPEVIPLEISN